MMCLSDARYLLLTSSLPAFANFLYEHGDLAPLPKAGNRDNVCRPGLLAKIVMPTQREV